jgi:hypothetical protein
MESPLLWLLILSRSVNKYSHHRQFLFLIGWFIKFGGNWLFTGFLIMFFDNNFLFFVTVTATLDDSRRSSIKILKEDHICILSIWFDCILLFTGF